MTVLTVMLYALVVVVAFLLIGLVLIQPSKGGGFGSSFGGVGESVFGARIGSHLTKLTVVMTAIFFIATLMLAAVVSYTSSHKETSLIEETLVEELSRQNAAEAVKPGLEAVVPVSDTVSAEPAK